MTVDIRAAAEAEAVKVPASVAEYQAFVSGAVWAQARLTPTREQIERALIGRDFIAGTDAVLALIDKLAAGESGAQTSG